MISVASAGRIGAGRPLHDHACQLSRPQTRVAGPGSPQPRRSPHRQPRRRTRPSPRSNSTTSCSLPIATQLGQENEVVRNLLLDAEHKIGELEIIKRSIGKLVDPVSKTLRAYEETKSEKLSLQSTLNTTRLAYSKLRDEFMPPRKRRRALEADGARLRDVVRWRSRAWPRWNGPRSSRSPR